MSLSSSCSAFWVRERAVDLDTFRALDDTAGWSSSARAEDAACALVEWAAALVRAMFVKFARGMTT